MPMSQRKFQDTCEITSHLILKRREAFQKVRQ
jgi:hypothetical protein